MAAQLHGLNLSGGSSTNVIGPNGAISMFSSQSPHQSPYYPSSLAAPNVTDLVMVKLSAVEDYLT